ncbi:MAG: A24 family peptidase, partial [Candidatus Edwardsbacteria bacterium]|nr:A24 family peptidase [Candidatus Edwardsbacteria bacterium]
SGWNAKQLLCHLAAGGGLIALAAWLGRRWYRQEAMGGGDIKLAAMLGAFLGWKAVLMAIFFGALSGTVVGLSLMIAGRLKDTRELQATHFPGERDDQAVSEIKPKAAVPFGPFLAFGAMAAVLFGSYLVQWYWGLF